MEELFELLKETTIDKCYSAGYDAGKNKPNEINSHFRFFSTPEKTKAWERGKEDGSKEDNLKKHSRKFKRKWNGTHKQ